MVRLGPSRRLKRLDAMIPVPRLSPPWRLAGLLAAATLLGGCAARQSTDSVFGFLTPYRIDIVQGNVLTRDQVELVKPGMTRAQVREILGTPLITDLFHADRWDYLFDIRRPGSEAQRRSVVVRFEGDRLVSIEAPELPTEREFVASISTFSNVQPRVLELTPEQRQALPVPPRREAPAAEPVGPLREYPPLEPL
jgi:outer membrane protein assembly factor BamE